MGTSEATEESKNKKSNGSKESELTYLIQGKSEISQHWFNLDTDWIEDNFMTRQPEFFKRLYCKNIPDQANKYWFTFSFTFGSVKNSSYILSRRPYPGISAT